MKKSRFLIGLAVVLGLVAGSASLSAKETEKKEKKAKAEKTEKAEAAPAAAEATPAATTPAGAVEYHGNTQSKKFHAPCSKDYNCKNCTAIFKTKEEAVKAGYTEVKCPEKKAK